MQSKWARPAWRGTTAAVTSWFALIGPPLAARGADAVASRPPAPPRSKAIVDHAVVPAGLHCAPCGAGACRVHGGHLAGCRNGMCEPHCPVRPSQYGFYHTQWRRWPGEGVVPASAEDMATPVAPPQSQVPTIDEESPAARDGTRADGEAGSNAEPETMPSAPDVPAEDGAAPADPIPERSPRSAPAAEQPGDEPPVPPTPPGEAPAMPGTDPVDGDPFGQSALPIPEPEIPLESGAMRYPAPVGRSLAAGIPPWRLLPPGVQRAADSVRGR